MPKKEITGAQLLRDRDLFKRLKRRITFSEKLLLMDCVGDYPAYQKALLELAKRRGVEIPPAD
jgi:hypothetical protein